MSNDQDTAAGSNSTLQELVRAEISSKLAEYRRILYAFLAGFGLLVTFLVANRLMSEYSLIVAVHDQIFGFRQNLVQAMGSTVAFSYSTQFQLELPQPRRQFINFYSDKSQEVVALVDIKHSGSGAQNRVAIRLNQNKDALWSGDDDITFQRYDLTEDIRKPAVFAPGAYNVHTLTFAIEPESTNKQDRVVVRVLINVIGLEAKNK